MSLIGLDFQSLEHLLITAMFYILCYAQHFMGKRRSGRICGRNFFILERPGRFGRSRCQLSSLNPVCGHLEFYWHSYALYTLFTPTMGQTASGRTILFGNLGPIFDDRSDIGFGFPVIRTFYWHIVIWRHRSYSANQRAPEWRRPLTVGRSKSANFTSGFINVVFC